MYRRHESDPRPATSTRRDADVSTDARIRGRRRGRDERDETRRDERPRRDVTNANDRSIRFVSIRFDLI